VEADPACSEDQKSTDDASGLTMTRKEVASCGCPLRMAEAYLFRDIIILMRDTGMRNESELYRMRMENLHWEYRVIFVPELRSCSPSCRTF